MIELKKIIQSSTALPSNPQLKINEIQCRSALNLSKIPGFEYCLNPYIGCSHGCIYCYATFMKRFRNHPEEWGKFVDVKINLPDVLRKEVQKKRISEVGVGTVQDAYQPIEAKYQITRQAIKILIENTFPFEILTKSSLIVRDIDLFKGYHKACVELTLTTLDENIQKIFEPLAASVSARLKALEKLIENRIETNIFFGPVIPYFSDSVEHIRKVFTKIQEIGIKRVLVDKLNYLESKIIRIIQAIKDDYPQAIPYYRNILRDQNSYKINLRKRIKEVSAGFNMSVEVLF